MTSIADGSVIIQTSAASVPAPPAWFGEVVLMAALLRKHGVLTKISEQVRFARRRFGRGSRDRLSRGADRAMPEASSAPWRPSTSDSSPLPSRSWPYLSVTD